ncbi:MAG: PAS domain-containing protein [Candidatus Aenigmarchaeota archaeon]|nr:PAS domain-containing protein [Candidatus Aenigmarchaeota archaeon]
MIFKKSSDKKKSPGKCHNKLEKSETRLKGILSSMEDLVFVFDKEGRFTFYHSSDRKKLYATPDKFMGKKHSEVMPPHMDKMFIKAVKKNRNGKMAEYEYDLKIGGKTKWFSVKLSPIIIDGKFEGSVAVSRDITDRKKVEKFLREKEKLYRTVFENSAIPIGIFGDDCVILICNSKFEKFSGYKKKEVEGRMHWYDFIPEKDRKWMLKYHKQRLEGKAKIPSEYDCGFIDRAGNEKRIHIKVGVIPGTKNRIVSVVDITKGKKTDERLKKKNEKLKITEKKLTGLKKEIKKLERKIKRSR